MSSIMSILSFSAIALFSATSSAHMILGSPPPYGSPDNSPLEADGSNFPCKATSNTGATVTQMTIGAPQPLSFIGSAVHGGGSCQISLTTDMPATKSSTWMVIHSIEGGCPAKGTPGNDAAGQSGGSNYTYTIPDGINPGSYTLAWTWFNKIGNREMYMNCASVKVNGGSKKRALTLNETLGIPDLSTRSAASFPGMFKANVPISDCTTVDSQDVQFPDPGSSVEKDGSGTLTPPTGPKCNVPAGGGAASGGSASASNSSPPAAASSASGSGSSGSGSSGSGSSGSSSSGSGSSGSGSSGSGSSGSGSSAPYNAGSAAASMASAAPSVAPSVASSAAPSVAASAADSAPSAPASPAVAAAPSSAPSAVSNSSSSSTTPSTSSTGTCTTAGQSICNPDGTQIGMCTTQLTVTWMPVAAGTKCVGGYQVFAKRSNPKFQKGYVRKGVKFGNW